MKLFNEIFIESLKDKRDKYSSTRIVGYITSIIIILFSLYFLSVGILTLKYERLIPIPGELIVIYTSLLTQQLILFGVNKYQETKIKEGE